MAITTTIPTNLDFPNRGVLERDAFVLAQETAQDLLAGGYTTALNQYAVELNTTQIEINTKAEQVANQAVDGGYSQTYIDATFTPKILNTQTDKATPVDADLIPLSDSASSFGLKKLSWLNIKNTIISSFGGLVNGLTAKATPVDADMIVIADSASSNASKKLTFANLKAMIFTNSALTGTPTAPTPASSDDSTKIATTAWNKLAFAYSFGTSGYIKLPTWLGGLVIQWGTQTPAVGSIITYNFPIAFPTQCFTFVASLGMGGNSGTSKNDGTGGKYISASQYQMVNYTGSSAIKIDWIAIGY